MTVPERIASTAVPARENWHARTRASVGSGSVGSWRERMEPWQCDLAGYVMAGRLIECGQELTGRARPGVALLARYAEVAAHRRPAARRRAALDLWRLRGEQGPVGAVGW